MTDSHPIPKALRDRFDQIEDAICRNRMERDAVFTQMRTAVQAHFMSSGTAEVERLRIDLELTRLARQGDQIGIDGLKALCDGFRAQLADAAQSLETISRLAGRDEFMEDMVDVRGYANSRAIVARGALSVIGEPPAPAAAECTSCDGSGEYIDAIGDWRGYCSCPAGVELKNRPAPTAVVLPDSDELGLLVARSAGQADRLHGCNHYTACEMTANNLMERIKELNP